MKNEVSGSCVRLSLIMLMWCICLVKRFPNDRAYFKVPGRENDCEERLREGWGEEEEMTSGNKREPIIHKNQSKVCVCFALCRLNIFYMKSCHSRC